MVRANWYSQHPDACTCNQCEEKKSINRQAGRKIGRNENALAVVEKSINAAMGTNDSFFQLPTGPGHVMN